MAKPESEMRALFRTLGRRSKLLAAARIASWRSVFGGALKERVLPDPKRIRGGSLPSQARGAKVKGVVDGFDEIHPGLKITVFHSGAGKRASEKSKAEAAKGGGRSQGHNQSPRPVVGLTDKQQLQFAKQVSRKLGEIGKKNMKIFKKSRTR